MPQLLRTIVIAVTLAAVAVEIYCMATMQTRNDSWYGVATLLVGALFIPIMYKTGSSSGITIVMFLTLIAGFIQGMVMETEHDKVTGIAIIFSAFIGVLSIYYYLLGNTDNVVPMLRHDSRVDLGGFHEA